MKRGLTFALFFSAVLILTISFVSANFFTDLLETLFGGAGGGGVGFVTSGITCTDSDGKDNFSASGYVISAEIYYNDYCDGNVAYDYYCSATGGASFILPILKGSLTGKAIEEGELGGEGELDEGGGKSLPTSGGSTEAPPTTSRDCSTYYNPPRECYGGGICGCDPNKVYGCGITSVGVCELGSYNCNGGILGTTCEGAINPVAEACSDGLDNDCDGTTDSGDSDCGSGPVCLPGMPCYPASCADGQTQSCSSGLPGICSAGTQTCVNSQWSNCIPTTLSSAEICDDTGNLDEDCDGKSNCLDSQCNEMACAPGKICVGTQCTVQLGCPPGHTQPCSTGLFGVCAQGTQTCAQDGSGYGLCVPITPASSEVCNDGKDNDCDGSTDEGCVCTPGSTQSCTTSLFGVCSAGTQRCRDDGTGWAACTQNIQPTSEICDDAGNLDEDCDNTRNCLDSQCNLMACGTGRMCINSQCLVCSPGATQNCLTTESGVCSAGTQTCAQDGSGYGSCTRNIDPTTEICNDGKDNDCDGSTDEGCVCTPGHIQACTVDNLLGVCAQGTQTCLDSGVGYGPCSSSISNPPQTETQCSDSLDNDCDGKPDSQDDDCHICNSGDTQPCNLPNLQGSCSTGAQECLESETGWALCRQTIYPKPENCFDGKDGDCDGKPDSQDDDCVCDSGQTKTCAISGGLGICSTGTQTCLDSGTGYGSCTSSGPLTEVCDDAGNLDEDCDGQSNCNDVGSCSSNSNCDIAPSGCTDADGDRYSVESDPSSCGGTCYNGQSCFGGGDCVDDSSANDALFIHPNVNEECDGIDNNCDGSTDEIPGSFGLGSGNFVQCQGISLSNQGQGVCSNLPSLCLTGEFQTCYDLGYSNPTASEILGDGLDNNCDNAIDEGSECSTEGETRACTPTNNCKVGEQKCSEGSWGICEEIGDKPNCNAELDCNPQAVDSCGTNFGICTPGMTVCEASGIWGTCQDAILPEIEICGNALDEDCDGLVNEGDCVSESEAATILASGSLSSSTSSGGSRVTTNPQEGGAEGGIGGVEDAGESEGGFNFFKWLWNIILSVFNFGRVLSGGVISETPEFFCSDSDNGVDYFQKGTGNGLNLEGVEVWFVDACYKGTSQVEKCAGESCFLREYWCDGQYFSYDSQVICKFGCVNGACVPDSSFNENCEYFDKELWQWVNKC